MGITAGFQSNKWQHQKHAVSCEYESHTVFSKIDFKRSVFIDVVDSIDFRISVYVIVVCGFVKSEYPMVCPAGVMFSSISSCVRRKNTTGDSSNIGAGDSFTGAIFLRGGIYVT